jgi:aminoglycoside phosphotransferase (APT) family kinase protein
MVVGMNTVALSASAVAEAVQTLVPDVAPVRVIGELRRGRSHASWIVDSRRGRLVAKVALSPLAASSVRLEEHCRLRALGAQVPQILGHTRHSALLGGAMLVVSGYLPGRDAQQAADDPRTVGRVGEAVARAGAVLAGLHALEVPGFGDDAVGLGPVVGSWRSAVDAHVRRLEASLDQVEVAPGAREVAVRGLDLLGRLAREVSPVVRPAAVHADVYLPNILLGPDDEFALLLDLEHVRWADPVLDFVKPAMWIFDRFPQWAGGFVRGYAGVAGRPPGWEGRISATTGWELLSGIVYWAQVEDAAMSADCLRRLTHWVASDGREHVWSTLRAEWP